MARKTEISHDILRDLVEKEAKANWICPSGSFVYCSRKEMVWTMDDGLASLDFLDFHRWQISSWENIKVFLPRERIYPLGKPWIITEYWTRRKRKPLVLWQPGKSCLDLQKIWTWPEFQVRHRDVSAAPCNGADGTNPLRRQDGNVSRIVQLQTHTRPLNMARIETKRTKNIHP